MTRTELHHQLQLEGLWSASTLATLDGKYGCYLLLLRMRSCRIRVGVLGMIAFPAGLYGYVGSAAGRSVTLGHRLRRHYQRHKPCRWHIDYLTVHPAVEPVTAYVSTDGRLTESRLARRCAARFPAVAGFGNTDRLDRTPSHLFRLSISS